MTRPSHPYVVRAAGAEDLVPLGRLGSLLVAIHHGFDAERFLAPDAGTPELYADFLQSQLGRPEVVLLVADVKGEVAGYVLAGMDGGDFMALRGPAGLIYDLIVDPARRGQGIGRALLQAAIAALEARGAPRIVLGTAEKNGTAQRLFAAAGFRRTMIEMTRERGGRGRS